MNVQKCKQWGPVPSQTALQDYSRKVLSKLQGCLERLKLLGCTFSGSPSPFFSELETLTEAPEPVGDHLFVEQPAALLSRSNVCVKVCEPGAGSCGALP